MSLNAFAPSYGAAATMRLTGADAATSSYFAISNPLASTKILILKTMEYTLGFDGTGATASISISVRKASLQGNPTTGTGITPVPFNTQAASALTSANVMFKVTPLTITITTDQGSIFQASLPASVTAAVISGEVNWANAAGSKGIRLAPGEGITLQNERVAIIGQIMSASFIWDEVPLT